MMQKRPNLLYILLFSFFIAITIFLIWGSVALSMFVQVPSWNDELLGNFQSMLYWVFLIGAILFIGGAITFSILGIGLFIKQKWAYTTSLILSTFVLFAFLVMTSAYFVTLFSYPFEFSIMGTITTICMILSDLLIIFLITRPSLKYYFLN